MGAASPSNCACPTPAVVAIPGTVGQKGDPGTNGTDGADGINPFTLVAGSGFTVPAADGVTTVTIPVLNSVWGVVGENVFIQGAGVFIITGIPGVASFTAVYAHNYAVNTHAGASIAAGSTVSPTGYQPVVTGITSLTDSTTGTPGNILAAGVGLSTLAFQIDAATIAAADLMTTYVPGYAFKILSFDARCNQPVTTGGKAANVSLKITGTPVTGGVIGLSGTYILGAAQAGSAVAGANTGAATDSISIVAASVTAFTEGSFMLFIRIQNMDIANAFSSIAAKVNSMLTQLGP